MLMRSFDVAAINVVVNAPEVRPFVGGGTDALDLTDAVARPENMFLMGEHGGFAMTWSAPRVYEVHTFILLQGRGEWARQAAKDAIHIMQEYATKLWTKILADQHNVVRFAQGMGMNATDMQVATLGLSYDVYEMELG
jgi:hypothetical protein